MEVEPFIPSPWLKEADPERLVAQLAGLDAEISGRVAAWRA